MNISEFLNGRSVQRQTVTRYIQRHKTEFEGHTKRKGKELELDAVATELLERKYPLTSPIKVIEDAETRKALIEAQAEIIRLQAKLMESAEIVADARVKMQLLEQVEFEKEDLKKELAKFEKAWFGLYRKRE